MSGRPDMPDDGDRHVCPVCGCTDEDYQRGDDGAIVCYICGAIDGEPSAERAEGDDPERDAEARR